MNMSSRCIAMIGQPLRVRAFIRAQCTPVSDAAMLRGGQSPGGGPLGNVRYERAEKMTRTPIDTAHARGHLSGAAFACGRRRSAGRSAHDATMNAVKTSGGSHRPGASPARRCDAEAPE